MQSNLFVCAPNLIGDIYRNNSVQSTGKFHKSYDFIDINQDGVFVLGTSDLCGRIWSGAVWLFSDLSHVPDVEKCLGSMDFDSGVSAGKWFNGGVNIAVGSDSGSVSILSISSLIDINKQYLSVKCILCDHEDGITSLDVSSDNMKIVTGSRDLSIKIFNVENVMTEKAYNFAHTQAVNSVSFKPGKTNILISTSGDGDSLLWDTRQEKPASLLLNTESGFTASTWIDDNYAVLGANSGSLHLVDVRKKEVLDHEVCSNRPIHFVNLERSSQILAVCADDPVVRVYDCSRKDFCKIYECEKHEDFVRGLCWKSPSRLYSCGYNMNIISHDISIDHKDSTTTNTKMEDNGELDISNKEK